MVTPATTIFYPETDGMPLPDGEYQLSHFMEIISILRHFFRKLSDAAVSGNTFIYYEEGNPRMFVSPDCYVSFGVNMDLLLENNNYRVWDMGKPPDFVMEIGSPSTGRQDLGSKRDLYASLGVVEYWMFDPSGGDHYGFGLRGETLVDGEYRELDMVRGENGDVWGYSPVLNLELHWREGRLRFYDPLGDRWLENMAETDAARDTERVARETAEVRAKTAEAFAEMERAARGSAETVADMERAARERAEAEREAAETRLAELEAELRRLRAQQA